MFGFHKSKQGVNYGLVRSYMEPKCKCHDLWNVCWIMQRG